MAAMADAIYIIIGLAAFAASWGLVLLCRRLKVGM
jgi:uncharacterized membrane protein YuzA (DUF378 family)